MNKSQTTKQGKRITAYYSETNPQTTWLSGYPKIINVLASMENNGRSKGVINNTRKQLNNLSRNANLDQPKQVKALIARMETGNAYKRMLVQSYNRYAKYYKLDWDPPHYKVASKEITVPTDEKIKMLIAAAKKPLSTKLELSYKTGLRPVEVTKLKVKDFDKDNNTINPQTAKNGKPRKLSLSVKLSRLLTERIQKRNLTEDNYIFGGTPEKYSYSFQRLKTTLAKRLNDPSIKRIRLYDLRHKFCMNTIEKFPHHPFLVMYLMGHKNLNTTEHYIHIQEYLKTITTNGKYLTATAATIEQAIPLIEQGYIEAAEFNGVKIFKKPN